MKTKLDRLIDKAREQEMEDFPLSAPELETIFDSADRCPQTNPKPKLRRIVMNATISAAAAALMLTGYLAFNAPDATNQQSNNSITIAAPAAVAENAANSEEPENSLPENSQVQIHSIRILKNIPGDSDHVRQLTDEQIQNLIQTGIADATPRAHRRLSSLITNKLGLLELSDAELERIGVFKEDNGSYYRATESEIEKGYDNYANLNSQLQEKGYNTNSDKLIIRKKSPLGFSQENNEMQFTTSHEPTDLSKLNMGDFSISINNTPNKVDSRNNININQVINEVLSEKLQNTVDLNPNVSTTVIKLSSNTPGDSLIDSNLQMKRCYMKLSTGNSVYASDIELPNSVVQNATNSSTSMSDAELNKPLLNIPECYTDTLTGSPLLMFGKATSVTIIGSDGDYSEFDNPFANTPNILPYTNWAMNAKTFPEPASVEISSVGFSPRLDGNGFNEDRFSFTSISSGIQCSDGTDAADKFLSGGSFNDCTSRLVGVRVFSGNDRVIKDSSDIKYNESILWFEATPEFIDKLPDRYKSSVLAELAAMEQINNGVLSQSEACSRLNDEKRFLGVCGNNSGAILSLNAYPMPAENSTNCFIELKEDRAITLSLYRSTGDLVRDFVTNAQFSTGKQSIPLDVSGLQKGLYFLVAESANGELAYMKFFVQ